jgi:WD40 repeat protein
MKRKIISGLIVVFVIFGIMFWSNFNTKSVRQLQGPHEGTDSVITVNDRLSVVSKNNHIYTWQWKDLAIWPVVAKPQAAIIAPVADDKIIYNASTGTRKLIITDLKADKELADLSLPYGVECKKIKASDNGGFIAASVLFDEGPEKNWLKIAVFDSNSKDLSFVFQKDTKVDDFTLYDFAVTNDGRLLAGAGKKDKAWIFATDVKNKNILWEKSFDEYSQFTFLAFSPDGKTLYVSEKVRYIISLDSATGKTIRVYEIPLYNTPAHQKQNISCMAVSPDGKILAADTEPACTVWYWDINTGKKIISFHASEFTVSDIAFSPDSKYLATGCLVLPEIKIWKVPQPK